MILAMITTWGCAPVPSDPLFATAPQPLRRWEVPGEAHPGWMAEVSARLRDAARAFEPDVGGYRAEVADRGMIARFDAAGAHISVGDDVIDVSTVGWGRDQRAEDEHRPAPALGACLEDRSDPAGDCVRRLEYSEPGRTEWWAGRDDGFQQGWTVDTPAPGDGALTIEIAVSGGYVVGDDTDLWIQGDGGGVVLVSGLEAHDAGGTTLDIRFEVVEDGFLLRVADAGARYPIAIDPVYTTPSWTVDGQEADGFGSASSSAGDVDNDGYDDVIVGAPDHGSSTGRAYVYLGSSSGLSSTAATTLTGDGAGSQFGGAVSGAGDVDDDGYDDVIVGAIGYDSYRGGAFVYLGSSAGVSTIAIATLSGEAESNYLGGAVSDAGDVNGDGHADVIVGAWGYGGLTGRAYVYLGSSSGVSSPAAATLTGEGTENYFAWSVSDAGDVDGDGYDDVIVGAPAYDVGAGRAYVYLGSSSGMSSAAATTLSGGPDDSLGRSVSRAGDVDNDGYDDVMVGAYYGDWTSTGQAYVYLGSSSGLSGTPATTLTAEAAGDQFGSVAAAGDVNNDGYADVIVGAAGHATSTGRVYLYLGSSTGVSGTAATTLTGEAEWDNFGSVMGAGDVNNDGYDDLIIGGAAARADVYLGSSAGVSGTAATTLTGVVSSETLGGSVSRAGDVNDDGFGDIIVGASGHERSTGRAYVFHGSSAGLSSTADTTLTGAVVGDAFGCSVSDVGDVDNDGSDDVIVGTCPYPADDARAYVFHGSPAGVSSTATTTLEAFCTSCSVSGAGDVNGDGFGDVCVGDPSALAAYVYLGSSGGVSDAVHATLSGESDDAGFAIAVSDAGDVDDDGYDDVIVGGYGRAYVFHGASTGVSVTATTHTNRASDDEQARSVSGAGDVNGDGYADVIVGVSSGRYEPYASRALVYLGSSSGVSAAESTTLIGDDLSFGASVSGAGDVDHDGYDDVIVGSPGAYGGSGSAFVYLGSASGLSTTPEADLSSGATEHDGYGASVSGAGDVNDDGYDDVLVGASSYSSGGGRAFVYDGDGVDGVDGDGDGYFVPSDCDDADAAISPGATEVCNAIDDDCDGTTDVGASDATTWYADGDADGYTDADNSVLGCTAPAGYSAASAAPDCDDADPTVSPGAADLPGDGIDQDCDGADAIGEDTEDTAADTDTEDTAADTDSDTDSGTDSGTDKGTENGCGCGANSRSGGGLLVGWAALLAASLRRRP
ncbi:MAG: FG-GAP-like repeat-containing protein [Pseudomonadota bacterium]|nr:FG-GAP-like repeat-containing protein [Pseudomonadota bacterium]